MKVMANPYHALDASGMLAGVCPAYEQMRPTTAMPMRKHVGAMVEVVDGTHQKYGSKDRPKGGMRLSRAARRVKFTGLALEVPANDPQAAAFYRKAVLSGAVIVADDPTQAKAALAKARADAIANFVAAYGKQPPVEKWAAQFQLDSQLAEPSKTESQPGTNQPGTNQPAPQGDGAGGAAATEPATEPAADTPSEPPADKGSAKAAPRGAKG
ncbi:MAG: hypothetical protein HOW73_20570 [Polyangiaceae bacterium]|nr:hypothetical protein [Polyangiaceae bacterium]